MWQYTLLLFIKFKMDVEIYVNKGYKYRDKQIFCNRKQYCAIREEMSKMHIVDNAVIMAAGTSSRFAPLSYEKPKALIEVRGEILIERQIRQLQEAGIPEIYIVTGYKAEHFTYLQEKFGVKLIHNPHYLTRNNNASIYMVRDILKNSFICSADNYFSENPFERTVSECYYAAVYAKGETKEWCMETDAQNRIRKVTIGGENAWYMLGHAFWDETFSSRFVQILEAEYHLPETENLLWESIFTNHLEELDMKIRKYPEEMIFEFDTLDELRVFDESYLGDTRSRILKAVASQIGCTEQDIMNVTAYKDVNNEAAGFHFTCAGTAYSYGYADGELRRN